MTNEHQYPLELLIRYYKELITLNTVTINNECENDKYKNLVTKLIGIRQLIIDKKAADISALYKPAPGLFIDKKHFNVLETIVQFYKDNPNIDYDLAAAEKYVEESLANQKKNSHHKKPVDTDCVQQLIQHIDQKNAASDAKLTNINDQVRKLSNSELIQSIAKSSDELFDAVKNDCEQMRSSLKKHYEILTDHITKSGNYTIEAIEKAHLRFAQKIESDAKYIINNVSEAINRDVTTKNNAIKELVQKVEDKFFYRSIIVLIYMMCLLFLCSMLSSRLTANKIMNELTDGSITVEQSNITPIKQKRH